MKCRVDQQHANAEQQQTPMTRQDDAYRPGWNLTESMTQCPRWSHELSEHGSRKYSRDDEDDLNIGSDHSVLHARVSLEIYPGIDLQRAKSSTRRWITS